MRSESVLLTEFIQTCRLLLSVSPRALIVWCYFTMQIENTIKPKKQFFFFLEGFVVVVVVELL